MKKIVLILLLLYSFAIKVKSQNYFYLNDKKYESTENLPFGRYKTGLRTESISGRYESIIIAKKNDGSGIIAISAKVSFNDQRIKGKLTIFLENGDLITCVDRRLYDHVDGYAITTYYLTINDIKTLKKYNIKTIRYNIQCLKPDDFSTDDGSYSTMNQYLYEEDVKGEDYSTQLSMSISRQNIKEKPHDIPKLINELFR